MPIPKEGILILGAVIAAASLIVYGVTSLTSYG